MAAVLEAIRAERALRSCLVEHDVAMVRKVTSRLYVPDFGQLIAEGPYRRGHRRRPGPPGLPRGHGVTAPLLELDHRRRRLRAVPALFDVPCGRGGAGARCAVGSNEPARPPSPGCTRASSPPPPATSASGARTSPAGRVPSTPAAASPTPRGPVGLRHPSPSRRTSSCPSGRRQAGHQRGPSLGSLHEAFPRLQQRRAGRRHPVRRQRRNARWPGARAAATAADRRRLSPRPGPDHRQRVYAIGPHQGAARPAHRRAGRHTPWASPTTWCCSPRPHAPPTWAPWPRSATSTPTPRLANRLEPTHRRAT